MKNNDCHYCIHLSFTDFMSLNNYYCMLNVFKKLLYGKKIFYLKCMFFFISLVSDAQNIVPIKLKERWYFGNYPTQVCFNKKGEGFLTISGKDEIVKISKTGEISTFVDDISSPNAALFLNDTLVVSTFSGIVKITPEGKIINWVKSNETRYSKLVSNGNDVYVSLRDKNSIYKITKNGLLLLYADNLKGLLGFNFKGEDLCAVVFHDFRYDVLKIRTSGERTIDFSSKFSFFDIFFYNNKKCLLSFSGGLNINIVNSDGSLSKWLDMSEFNTPKTHTLNGDNLYFVSHYGDVYKINLKTQKKELYAFGISMPRAISIYKDTIYVGSTDGRSEVLKIAPSGDVKLWLKGIRPDAAVWLDNFYYLMGASIYKFNKEGKKVLDFKQDYTISGEGITVKENKIFAVGHQFGVKSNWIYNVSPSTGEINLFAKIDTSALHGLANNGKEIFATSRSKNVIYKIDEDGNYKLFSNKIDSPRAIVCYNDYIYVSSYFGHSIVKLDNKGFVLKEVKIQKNNRHLIGPACMLIYREKIYFTSDNGVYTIDLF